MCKLMYLMTEYAERNGIVSNALKCKLENNAKNNKNNSYNKERIFKITDMKKNVYRSNQKLYHMQSHKII
jgi:hypothetical protein